MENNFDNENVIEDMNEEVEVVQSKKFDIKKEIKEWAVAILIAVVVAFVIRTFFFEMVQVDGPSMENTMHTGDRLIVQKLNYTPKQGDVVVFRPDQSPKTPYIKRVIATEGQTVYIDFNAMGRNGKVYVDGELYEEDYIKNPTNRNGDVNFGTPDNPLVVPEDCVFVMGDNRMQSHDGRSLDVSSFREDGDASEKVTYFNNKTGKMEEKSIYYGCVHKSDIIGKAVFRWWPLDNLGTLK